VTETPELHARALARFGEKVEAIRDDQWHAPTPCSEWDVRDLVNHLVSENAWMPPLFEGKTVADVGSSLEGDLLGEDPKGAWRRSATAAEAAVRGDGAMERPVHISMGDVPGADYTEQVLADLAVHGWDLARAIGADDTIDPVLLDAVEPFYERVMAMWKLSGAFGGDVDPPEGSDRQTRLLALLGREAWGS
jgi:uncharacterized protein (TIGR03086 family)